MSIDHRKESESWPEQDSTLAFSQAEYDEDELDAAEEELGLDLRGSESILKGAKPVLLAKLQASPAGDFHVTDDSLYSDTTWRLTAGNVVKFDSETAGINDLKRSIMFHVLPEFAPWGGSRSHNTTHSTGYSFALLEKYVFLENRLNATKPQIAAIDASRLNDALDKAKASGYLTTYSGLYFFVRLWLQLSAQKLIPESLRLSVYVGDVETQERRSDIIEHFRRHEGTYKPLGERELMKLMDYAVFWTEKALPALLDVREFLIAEGIDKAHAKVVTQVASRAASLEESLTVIVDDVEVMKPVVSYSERVPKGETRLYQFWGVSWIRPYARALNKVRNAVFIWIAILTGARKRELGILTIEDILFDEKSGEYSVRITRFKTTNDPNFAGVQDVLPVPAFLGEIVRDYISLRDVRNFSSVKALFGHHNHSRLGRAKTSYDAYIPIEQVIRELQEALSLDGLHCHRFRKTIAEILINRDERNIDIIRLLFGHTSYAMTLKYIARNPYLVRSVVLAIEESFTDDFEEIISGLKSGVYAGVRAMEIAEKLQSRGSGFVGKVVRAEIHSYVSHLVRSGEPVYIHRTSLGVGTYCLSHENIFKDFKLPCNTFRTLGEGSLPNPKNCQVECKNLIVLGAAKASLTQNIQFYSKIIEGGSLTERSLATLSKKLLVSEQRLEELDMRSSIAAKDSISRSKRHNDRNRKKR